MPLPTEFSVIIGRKDPDGVAPLGNGFYIMQAGHVVTTRQVVGYHPSDLVVIAPRMEKINTYQEVAGSHYEVVEAVLAEFDPIRDLVILKTPPAPGLLMGEIGDFDDLKTGASLIVTGFPHAGQGKTVLIGRSTELGAKVNLECVGIPVKHGLLNLASTPVHSGSAVFETQKGLVVGVLMDSFPPTLREAAATKAGLPMSQTSSCVAADYLREMIG